MSKPCAQEMSKISEPRQNQERNCYQQEELAIHDIPFGYFCDGLSNRKYIIRTRKRHSIYPQLQGICDTKLCKYLLIKNYLE
jgi:hypothetical protein